MNIQKFQKYSHEISPLYPALADKAEAISRAIENSPINVTAISDGDGILVKHIIDSLCCAEAVARYADAARGEGADGDSSGAERRLTLCDVGSGGGFPALPIAAALGDISVCALDSAAKKCRFIEESAASAGITNLTSVCARAEEAKGLFGTFDFVTARAVAALPVLIEICAPLLKVGGYFFAMKGKNAARGACLVGARRARARADARGHREVRAAGGQRKPCDIRLPKDIADTRALPARIQKDRESAALSGAFVLPGRRRRTRYDVNLQLHVNLPCPREMGNAHFSNVKSET